jgi:hypothetical protein
LPAQIAFPGGILVGVSCTSAVDCTGVGHNASSLPLYVTETAEGWGTPTVIAGSPAGIALLGVSCSSADACTAVGQDGNSRPFYVTETPPPFQGMLSSMFWGASNNATSASPVSYSWNATTATSSSDFDQITMTVPSDSGAVSGGLSVDQCFGFSCAGAKATVGDGTVTLTVPSQSVAASVPLEWQISGFTNTATPQSSTSTVTTSGEGEGPLDQGTSEELSFGSSSTGVEVAVPLSAEFTNSAPNIYITPIPGNGSTAANCGSGTTQSGPTLSEGATGTQPCPVVLGLSTNDAHGYTLSATLTPANLTDANHDTLPNDADATAGCDKTQPGDAFGATAAIAPAARSDGAVLEGGWASSGYYCGYDNGTPTGIVHSSELTGSTGDTLTLQDYASVDFAQPSGVYGGTITYSLTLNVG